MQKRFGLLNICYKLFGKERKKEKLNEINGLIVIVEHKWNSLVFIYNENHDTGAT